MHLSRWSNIKIVEKYDPVIDKYLTNAYDIAAIDSMDPNTQLGSVIVHNDKIVAYGGNKFPPLVKNTIERWQPPQKYAFVVHSEANACYHMHECGLKFDNSVHFYTVCGACNECAKTMIRMGVTNFTSHLPAYSRFLEDPRWGPQLFTSFDMFAEAGLAITLYNVPLQMATTIKLKGCDFNPCTAPLISST